MPGPFTFIDLFAGIGGFRMTPEKPGADCRFSRKTCEAWFGQVPFGDIRTLNPANIPNHDLLAAGFPCQPFSRAGVSQKNSLGREHGFRCNGGGIPIERGEGAPPRRPTPRECVRPGRRR